MDLIVNDYPTSRRILQQITKIRPPRDLPSNYQSDNSKLKENHIQSNHHNYMKNFVHYNQFNKIETQCFGLRLASININGLVSNYDKQKFLYKWMVCNEIDILCLQEWCVHHQHPNANNLRLLFPFKQFPGYQAHAFNLETAILYKNTLKVFPHQIKNNRNTQKQWRTWISVYNDKKSFNVSSLYHSPTDIKNHKYNFMNNDITTIHNANKKFTNYEMIFTDTNGSNEIWDRIYEGANIRGQNIADWITENNLFLCNDGSPTHYNRSTKKQSAIDLTIVSENLYDLIQSWYVNYESRTINVQNRNKSKHDISLLSSFKKNQNILDFSDHYFIVSNVRFQNIQLNPIDNYRFNFNMPEHNTPIYVENLKEYLPDFDAYFNKYWHIKDKLDDIIEYFQNIIKLATINSFGVKIVNKLRNYWESNRITKWLKVKKRYQRKYHRIHNKNSACATHIKSIINKFDKKIKSHKKLIIDAYSMKLEKDINNIQYKDNKTFFNLLHHQHKDKSTKIPPLRNKNDEIIAITTKEQSEVLHQHFNRKIKENEYQPHHLEWHQKIESIVNESFLLDNKWEKECAELNKPIEENEIYHVLKECKLNTAPGYDHIYQKMINYGKSILVPYLKKIFNLSFIIHKTCPNIWKASNIYPIPKPGRDNSYPKNNRPISLMPILMRILCKILCKRYLSHCMKYKLFKWWNNGFQPNKSCDDILIRLAEKIYHSFELKSFTEISFMDIASAYDTVWVKGLLYKMKTNFKISGTFLIWISGYLICRFNRVTFDNHKTDWKITDIGEQQGDPLSPPFWCTFINDYELKNDSVELLALADDMSMYSKPSIISTTKIDELQNELDNFYDYTLTWKLILNSAKCNSVTITRKQNYKAHVYNMNKVGIDCIHAPSNAPSECTHNPSHPQYKKSRDTNGTIELTDDNILIPSQWQMKMVDKHTIPHSIRILGLQYDPKLNFNAHVEKIYNSCMSALYHLARIAYCPQYRLSPLAIWKIYLSCIRPKWEYGMCIYSSSSQFEKFEVIQNKAAKIALRIRSIVPNDILRSIFKITSVSCRLKQMQIKLWNNIIRSPSNLMKKHNFLDWKQYIISNSSCIGYMLNTRNIQRSDNINYSTTNLQYYKNSPLSRMYENIKDLTDDNNNILLEYIERPLKPPPSYSTNYPKHFNIYSEYEDFESDFKIKINEWEDVNYRNNLQQNDPRKFWNNLLVYTDGSCDPNPGPGGYGTYDTQQQIKINQYIDHPTTINYCELIAIKNVLENHYNNIFQLQQQNTQFISIFTDSMFCINLFSISGYPQDKYYWDIINICLKLVNQFNKNNITINLIKVPAHKDIIGNNIADEQAKIASSISKEAIKNKDNIIIFEKTPAIVDNTIMMERLNQLENKQKEKALLLRKQKVDNGIFDPTTEIKSNNLLLKSLFVRDSNYNKINKFAGKCLLNDMRGLTSLDARIISKLRTETAYLALYLKHYVGVGDGICKNCNSNCFETVSHYLLECDKYNVQRIKWRRKMSKIDRFLSLPQHFDAIIILFPHYWQISPTRMDKNYKEKMKTNEKIRCNLLESICTFVKETKRFENKYGI